MTKNRGRDHRNDTQKLIPSFHIEGDGRADRLSLSLFGISLINELSSTCVAFVSRHNLIKIEGNELKIKIFESKIVEISGKIVNITFTDKRNAGVKNEA